jgi:hypothetical protein
MNPNVNKLVREAMICSLVAGCLFALVAGGRAFGSSGLLLAGSFGLGLGFAAGFAFWAVYRIVRFAFLR